MCTHIYIKTYLHIYIHTYTYIIHTHIHTYIHTFTHTHTHTNVSMDSAVAVTTRLPAGRYGFESRKGQEFFFSRRPDWFWGPPTLLLSG